MTAVPRDDGHDAAPADEYLLDAISTLPYKQRVVVVARYWAGWTEVEIANAMGCRPGTVKSLASRALHRPRKEVERRSTHRHQ